MFGRERFQMTCKPATTALLVVFLFLSTSMGSTLGCCFGDYSSANETGLGFRDTTHTQPVKSSLAETNLSKLNLTATFDEQGASANCTLLVDYFNGAPISLTRIPFHLYLSGMIYEARKGNIVIESVTTIGTSTNVTNVEMLSYQQLMWVDFDEAIQPGNHILLNITFQSVLPDGNDRSGVHGTDLSQDKIYTFTGFFPIPCVYDQWDGWNIDPYLDVGDPFYFNVAWYDLVLDVPEGMVIAATGEVMSHTTNNGRTQYHYNISYPVREVTFSASRYYHVESFMYHGVNVSTYFLPVSANLWETDSLNQAIRALDLFNSTFGAYPYPTLNVVEQHAFYGGMEYPCQVYVTRVISQQIQAGTRVHSYLELVIAHEVGHQWWSQLVGDDCVDWGFLDEGLTTWSHSYYGEYYYSDWEHFQSTTFLDSVRTFYATYQSGTIINQSNTVRPDLTTFVDYIQTPLILEKLRQTIGTATFLAGLRLFFQENVFKIATLNDLQSSFEEAANENLGWFFMPWFSNGYLPDYSIVDAEYSTETSRLDFTIVDQNEIQNDYTYCQKIPVRVYSGASTQIAQSEVWVNGTTRVSLVLDNTPSAILLDYTGYILVQLPDDQTSSYSTSNIAIVYGGAVWVIVLALGAVVVVIALSFAIYRRTRR
jgi:hypothetical protein